MCSKFLKLKDYFERLLCWLDHWLSCMLDCIHVYVFLLSKNCFEKLAWHLLDTFLSVELLKPFSYHNPDCSSILGGSIKKAPASSIAPRHLVDRLSFCSWIWFLVARYLNCRWPFYQHLPWQLPRCLSIPHLSSITKGSIYTSSRDPFLISSISLNLSAPVHLPNTLSFTPIVFLKLSSNFFKFFYTW